MKFFDVNVKTLLFWGVCMCTVSNLSLLSLITYCIENFRKKKENLLFASLLEMAGFILTMIAMEMAGLVLIMIAMRKL